MTRTRFARMGARSRDRLGWLPPRVVRVASRLPPSRGHNYQVAFTLHDTGPAATSRRRSNPTCPRAGPGMPGGWTRPASPRGSVRRRPRGRAGPARPGPAGGPVRLGSGVVGGRPASRDGRAARARPVAGRGAAGRGAQVRTVEPPGGDEPGAGGPGVEAAVAGRAGAPAGDGGVGARPLRGAALAGGPPPPGRATRAGRRGKKGELYRPPTVPGIRRALQLRLLLVAEPDGRHCHAKRSPVLTESC